MSQTLAADIRERTSMDTSEEAAAALADAIETWIRSAEAAGSAVADGADVIVRTGSTGAGSELRITALGPDQFVLGAQQSDNEPPVTEAGALALARTLLLG